MGTLGPTLFALLQCPVIGPPQIIGSMAAPVTVAVESTISPVSSHAAPPTSVDPPSLYNMSDLASDGTRRAPVGIQAASSVSTPKRNFLSAESQAAAVTPEAGGAPLEASERSDRAVVYNHLSPVLSAQQQQQQDQSAFSATLQEATERSITGLDSAQHAPGSVNLARADAAHRVPLHIAQQATKQATARVSVQEGTQQARRAWGSKVRQEPGTRWTTMRPAPRARDSTLHKALQARDEELQRTKRRIAALEEAQTSARARETQLSQKNQALADCAAETRRELQSAKRGASEAARVNQALQMRNVELEQQSNRCSGDALETTAELQVSKKEVALLQVELTSSRAEREAAEAKVASAAADATVMHLQVQELMAYGLRLRHDNELQQRDLTTQRDLTAAAQRGLREAKRSLQESEETHQRQVRKLQQEAEALGEELHSRDNAILTLTTDLAARQREVEALHRDSTALAAAQVQLRAAQKEVDASDLTLQVERASIETAVQEQTSSELKLRRRIVELTGQVGLWVQEVGRQREENEGLQVRCATAQAVQSSGAGSVSRRPGGDEAT
jgi:hypothetical protein